jgi:hypothetical protein
VFCLTTACVVCSPAVARVQVDAADIVPAENLRSQGPATLGLPRFKLGTTLHPSKGPETCDVREGNSRQIWLLLRAAPRSYKIDYSRVLRRSNKGRNSLKTLVGAGRFERPTPCAQGIRVGSKGSIVFRRILTFTTIWGICSSLDSQPK